MVSDILSQAQNDIVRILVTQPDVYTGDLKAKIEKLVEDMDEVRMLPGLDCPPEWPSQERQTIEEIKQDFIQKYL
jgi:hypothetical protein